jgi:hypothetical protein
MILGSLLCTGQKSAESIWNKEAIVIHPDISIVSIIHGGLKNFSHPAIPIEASVTAQNANLRKFRGHRLYGPVGTAVIDKVCAYAVSA